MYFKRTKPMSKANLSDSRYFTPEELFLAGWQTNVFQSESEDSTVYAVHRFLDVCSKEQNIIAREIVKARDSLLNKRNRLTFHIKNGVYIFNRPRLVF